MPLIQDPHSPAAEAGDNPSPPSIRKEPQLPLLLRRCKELSDDCAGERKFLHRTMIDDGTQKRRVALVVTTPGTRPTAWYLFSYWEATEKGPARASLSKQQQ